MHTYNAYYRIYLILTLILLTIAFSLSFHAIFLSTTYINLHSRIKNGIFAECNIWKSPCVLYIVLFMTVTMVYTGTFLKTTSKLTIKQKKKQTSLHTDCVWWGVHITVTAWKLPDMVRLVLHGRLVWRRTKPYISHFILVSCYLPAGWAWKRRGPAYAIPHAWYVTIVNTNKDVVQL